MFFDNILGETGSSYHMLSRLTEHHFVVMRTITRANWFVFIIYIYLLLYLIDAFLLKHLQTIAPPRRLKKCQLLLKAFEVIWPPLPPPP